MIPMRIWSFGYLSLWLFLTTEAHVIDAKKGYETLRFDKDQATENDGIVSSKEDSADYLVIIQTIEEGKKRVFSYEYTGKLHDFLPPAVNSMESMEEMVQTMQLKYGDIGHDGNSLLVEEIEIDDEELTDMFDNRENEHDGRNMDHSDVNGYDTGNMLHSWGNGLNAENMLQSAGTGRDEVENLPSERNGRVVKNMLQSGENGGDSVNVLQNAENGHDAGSMLHRKKRESDGKHLYYGRSRKCNMAWHRARKALESCGVEMKTKSTRDEAKEHEVAGGVTKAGIWAGDDKSEGKREDETSNEKTKNTDDAAGNGKDDQILKYTKIPQRQ